MTRSALLMGLALALAAGGAEAQSVARGQALTARHCGGCHAVGTSGKSPEPAAPPFRELHRRYEPEQLGEALGEGLLSGHPMMPEFRFPPKDVESIVLYLKSIQARQPG